MKTLILILSLGFSTLSHGGTFENQCRLLGYALVGLYENQMPVGDFCYGAQQRWSTKQSLGKAICDTRSANCPLNISTPAAICRVFGKSCDSVSDIPSSICTAYGKTCPRGVTLGRAICEVANENCLKTVTTPAALCKAFGTHCWTHVSLPEAICRIGGVRCETSMTTEQALCRVLNNGKPCEPEQNIAYWAGYLIKLCP